MILKTAVFDAKTGLQKLLWQAKLQTFFEMVSIFEFMRVEAFSDCYNLVKCVDNKYSAYSFQFTPDERNIYLGP